MSKRDVIKRGGHLAKMKWRANKPEHSRSDIDVAMASIHGGDGWLKFTQISW